MPAPITESIKYFHRSLSPHLSVIKDNISQGIAIKLKAPSIMTKLPKTLAAIKTPTGVKIITDRKSKRFCEVKTLYLLLPYSIPVAELLQKSS